MTRPARAIAAKTVAIVTASALAITGTAAFAWSMTDNPSAAAASQTPIVVPASDVAPTDQGVEPTPEPTQEPTQEPNPQQSSARINGVVLVVADDLDWALFNQIPRLKALQDRGLTFTNHTVTNSLCCPSRVSILRAQYVHNHRVISNIEATGGGWPTYRRLAEEQDSLPTWLKSGGVHTGFMGKYLNQYPDRRSRETVVPPGWDTWVVPVTRLTAYEGLNYRLNRDGEVTQYGDRPKDFLNDVLDRDARKFLRNAPRRYFLNFSTYAPHKPFPIAPRHRNAHAKAVAPRTPLYNTIGVDPPAWLQKFRPMSQRRLNNLDDLWRDRARSAESIADSVESIMGTLRATGRDKDTLVIVTSDNGYHVATRQKPKGKRSPYAEDIVVPMVVLGPGIIPGTSTDAMTSTIDLAPTVTDLIGGRTPMWTDGRSLVPFLRNGDQAPADWRTGVLTQSLGESRPGDPDYEPFAPPKFNALRTPQWLFTNYQTGERELYDLKNDPFEQVNIVRTANPVLLAQLQTQLDALSVCRGETCRIADRILPQEIADPVTPPQLPDVTDLTARDGVLALER